MRNELCQGVTLFHCVFLAVPVFMEMRQKTSPTLIEKQRAVNESLKPHSGYNSSLRRTHLQRSHSRWKTQSWWEPPLWHQTFSSPDWEICEQRKKKERGNETAPTNEMSLIFFLRVCAGAKLTQCNFEYFFFFFHLCLQKRGQLKIESGFWWERGSWAIKTIQRKLE